MIFSYRMTKYLPSFQTLTDLHNNRTKTTLCDESIVLPLRHFTEILKNIYLFQCAWKQAKCHSSIKKKTNNLLNIIRQYPYHDEENRYLNEHHVITCNQSTFRPGTTNQLAFRLGDSTTNQLLFLEWGI